MKYQDKYLTINSEAIPIFDTERPTQALIDLFNPPKNVLIAQSTGIVCRVNGILHEISESFSFGINDTRLHCLLPIIIYGRKAGFSDEFFSVSNNLVIKEGELARDLLVSVSPKFFEDSLALLDAIFKSDKFVYLIFGIEDEHSIATAIEKISQTRGAITIHNPFYKNTTNLMKFCLERNLHLIENIDGSADIFRF
ncbi:MAG: hypothetical protein CMK52_01720 [Proteobacteria bacterium]|nr:hypothetical protein [Pseudomonadota bacterium]|tara:strand:- start:867 stop:1454 length:588 start_codon:yes stop_codon:yes gene_type:complete